MLCREFSLVKHFAGGYFALPLCCRSWGCDYCRPGRKREVTRAATNGNPLIFVTLTVNPAWGTDKEERARQLVLAWRAYVKLSQDEGRTPKIPYFCVFEATANGEPHLHILCRVKWISHKHLSKFMKTWMNAPNVWVTVVRSTKRAGEYMAKYMGKEPGKFGTCKRYWQTRDYQEHGQEDKGRKRPNKGGWVIWEQTIEKILEEFRTLEWTLTYDGEQWTILSKYPP